MGNLVDTFIVASRPEWMDVLDCPDQIQLKMILDAIPAKYRLMLQGLIREFQSLDLILDTRDPSHAGKVMQVALAYESEDVLFSHRYRGQCLQQIIRTTFYQTLQIIQNDFNHDKYNNFYVTRSNLVISEHQWTSSMPEEQVFLHRAVDWFLDKGYGPVTTSEGITYSRTTSQH